MAVLAPRQENKTTNMKARSKFIVTIPRFGFMVGLCAAIVLALVVIMQTIFSEEPPHVAMDISFGLLMLPSLHLMLMAKIFKVVVNGQKISVRTAIGRKYNFDVSEITKAYWNKIERRDHIDITRSGNKLLDLVSGKDKRHTQRILIKTTSGKKLSIESTMTGFSDMAAYIAENVDDSRIIVANSVSEVIAVRLGKKDQMSRGYRYVTEHLLAFIFITFGVLAVGFAVIDAAVTGDYPRTLSDIKSFWGDFLETGQIRGMLYLLPILIILRIITVMRRRIKQRKAGVKPKKKSRPRRRLCASETLAVGSTTKKRSHRYEQ